MTPRPVTPPPAEPTPQGELLGLPYDLRRPTLARVKARLWQPGGPLLTPKVWGWGYTFNFAHPGAWALTVVIAATVALAAWVA